jgi:hypothetical protein
MVESNAYVPTNRERHPKKCDYFSLRSSSPGAYRLQKTGYGIASRPRVYASLESEIRCLKKGHIAETHKVERDNPTSNGDDFRPRTPFSQTWENYEGN